MARKPKAAAEKPADVSPEELAEEQGELAKLIVKTMDKVLDLNEKKRAIGEEINQQKASLQARGISRGAFNRAYRDYVKDLKDEENEGKLNTEDAEYEICRAALGLPLYARQSEMFPTPGAAATPEPPDLSTIDLQGTA